MNIKASIETYIFATASLIRIKGSKTSTVRAPCQLAFISINFPGAAKKVIKVTVDMIFT